MNDADKIKSIYEQAKIDTLSNADKAVLKKMKDEFLDQRNALPKNAELSIWRIIMKSPIIKLAAAAVIILCIAFMATYLTGNNTNNEDPKITVTSDTPTDPQKQIQTIEENKNNLQNELAKAKLLFEQRNIKQLIAMLDSKNIETQLAAANYLAKIGDTAALEKLKLIIASQTDTALKNQLQKAIEQITKKLDAENQKTIITNNDVNTTPKTTPVANNITPQEDKIPNNLRCILINVTDKETNKPLPDTDIRLDQFRDPLSTDSNGLCLADINKTPQSFNVHLRKNGYLPASSRINIIDKDSPLLELNLTMQKGLQAGGHVVNEQGNYVKDANVYFYYELPENPYEGQSSAKIEAKTNEKGYWLFDAIPESLGNIFIHVEHPDYMKGGFTITGLEINKFFAKNLNLTLEQGSLFSGFVVTQDGLPVENAKVFIGHDRYIDDPKARTKTTANGYFEFSNLSESTDNRYIVTIQAPGYAPLLKEILYTKVIDSEIFTLKPGNTIKAQVVDVNGNPIEAAMVYCENWRTYRALNWQTYTDSQGRFVWNYAPADAIQINVQKEGFIEFDNANDLLTPSEQEYLIVLRDPIKVTGTVVDANTGLPIEYFKLIPGWKQNTNYNKSIVFQHSIGWIRDCIDGNFSYNFTQDGKFYGVKIQADGYADAISRDIDPNEQNVVLNFKLQKENIIYGKVVNQANEPVNKSTIYLIKNLIDIENNILSNATSEFTTKTDPNGLFAFNKLPQDLPYNLVVFADQGMAIASSEQFKQNTEIVIKPFGNIAGNFYIGSKPAANREITFAHTDFSRNPRGVFIQYKANTDANGLFSINNVMTGNMEYDNNTKFKVESGQTTQLTIGGDGRTITGCLAAPEGMETQDILTGSGNVILTSIATELKKSHIPMPQNYDQMTYMQAYEWRKQYLQTEQGKIIDEELTKKNKSLYYGRQIDINGCFCIDNVAPGKYLLKATVYRRDRSTMEFPMIAKAATEILIPPIEYPEQIDEPLDLGMIKMVKNDFQVGNDAPDFEVPAINRDASIKLDDFKGQYLLLNFFDRYITENQPQHLDTFRQINITAKARPDFQMVIIYLDSAFTGFLRERIIAEYNIDCPYGFAYRYNSIIENIYNVDNLPYSVLIDPQGKVISIGLKGQELIDYINDTLP